MSASYSTKVTLAMRSGNLCAFLTCRVKLTCDGNITGVKSMGQAAHIYGEKKGAARYKDDMNETERNDVSNLLYLCPSCHTKIDTLVLDYPAYELIRIKTDHENWVSQRLDESMSEVTFAELDVAAKAIAAGTHSINSDFSVITPEEKIQKNGLTKKVKVLILTGLSRSSEVSEFLVKSAQLDPDFPQRLKEGFKRKYLDLKETISGDELFMEMFHFAQSRQSEQHCFITQSAILAILVHLFHLCEIFEK